MVGWTDSRAKEGHEIDLTFHPKILTSVPNDSTNVFRVEWSVQDIDGSDHRVQVQLIALYLKHTPEKCSVLIAAIRMTDDF